MTARAKGLQPDRLYHYRLVVRTDRHVVTGADRTFRTPAGAIETLPPDAPDPTFGTEQPPGWTRVYAGESSSFLNSGVRLPDGRILAVGQDAVASVGQWTLERFLPDGRPDPSFGDGGVREIDVGPLGGVARDIELLPDGRFVVVGTATDERGGFDRAAFAAMRFHPYGARRHVRRRRPARTRARRGLHHLARRRRAPPGREAARRRRDPRAGLRRAGRGRPAG